MRRPGPPGKSSSMMIRVIPCILVSRCIMVRPLDASHVFDPQSITQDDRARIRLVADAMRRKAAESEILAALIGSGIPQEAASEFYRVVAHGLRSGVGGLAFV